MWSSEDFQRAESAIFAGALLGLLLVLLGVGRGADLALLDRMQRFEEPAPARVAILDLDDRTLRAYGWPVDPGLYAAVFELLSASGAKGVGVDLEFAPAGVALGPAQEVEADPADSLMGQVAEARGVVFGVQSLRRRGTTPPARCGKDENAPLAPLRAGLEDVRRAHLYVRTDPTDGVYRWARPCISTATGCLPDLAGAVSGRPEECAETLVPFSRAFSDFPRMSLYEVVTASGSSEAMSRVREVFGDRYVLVGASAASVGDIGRTPARTLEPLVSVHANRLQAIEEGRSLVAIPPWLGGFFGLLLALCLTPLRWPARAFLAVSATGVALAWVVSLSVFWAGSAWVPWSALAWPFTMGAMAASAQQGWRHLRHNQMVTQAFGQYVSPDVLDWLKVVGARALDPSEAERREVAVLFSDVAGYTSLSNRLPPADIMRSLRLYLDAMVPIVQKHGGYLDKINGDGLMVLFGAPRSIGDHSQAAVACAIEMQHKVRAMQAEWEAITGGPLTIRVGVATGHAFVGNLGAVGHIEYTAIGRVVNLAARLEPKAPLGGVALCATTVERIPRKPEGDWISLDLKGYEAGEVKAWAVEAGAVDAFALTKPD